ncbi:helix-turn-helix transcriptional regulator [uncultured Intestinimonas sp.]|uniref:helix-turn-helix domain-containing protein n=1 Tax=uncultured Intestinimonas sp. TaxID=1689265 RepID=UPI0025D34A06|nr:helix-turn-helix transcriptional regulator [uncultured Intestinimonas sp.]
MPFNKKVFGERLREVRKQCGEAQTAIAKLIDVSVPQVSDMENGKKTTTVEKMALICEHYRVSADYLLGLTDDPTPWCRREV